jgi:hypothetical protein
MNYSLNYVGADYRLERFQVVVDATYAFGSGFPDASDSLFGQCATKNCRLTAHSVLSVAIGKGFSNRVEKIEIENVTNNVYPVNLGSEFNSSHVSPPRLVAVRMGYRL